MSDPHSPRDAVQDDAIDLLANDQDEIAELFQRYDALAEDGAPSTDRRALAEELCSLLVVHGAIKEEIFYPAARNRIDEEYLIDEALVAQDSARSMIDDIQAADSTEARYDALVKMLKELVMLAFDQERSSLFPLVRESGLDLSALGAEMSARQEILLTADEDEETDPA